MSGRYWLWGELQKSVLGVGEPSIGRDIAEFAESPICTPSNEQPHLHFQREINGGSDLVTMGL
jgi:hypothetical protein